MSPLLFNLVADSLIVLLDVGVDKGHIKSVLADLLRPKGISHVQYADDTMIMIDGSERSILKLKLILYYFEWLPGLKNSHKSEVYVFRMERKEKRKDDEYAQLCPWYLKVK